MKITIKLRREEAQRILGESLAALLGGSRAYKIEEVTWSSYGSTVEIELSDEAAEAEEAT